MKVAVLRAPRSFELVEEPEPEIRPDEVLLRVAACGVCTSELDVWTGAAGDSGFPRFPGHEVSGTVERVGSEVTGLEPGRTVAAWVTSRWFGEYVGVRAEHCLPVEGAPEQLALAEPLGCAVNAVELANVSLGDDVLVVGAGFMGALVLELVAMQGVRELVVADTRPEALERARALGATRTINPASESLPDAVSELTGGRGVDVAFEVTGAQQPLLVLGDVTRMSGKIVIVGYHQGGERRIPLAQWNYRAYQILNAHFREPSTILRGMRIGMRLLSSGRLGLDGLVTHRFPLEEVNRAFEVAEEKPRGFVKSVVCVDHGQEA